MRHIVLPKKRPDEDRHYYDVRCDTCRLPHEILIPQHMLDRPSCDVEPVEFPCDDDQCEGSIHWQAPDDSDERRRRARQRVRERSARLRGQLRRMQFPNVPGCGDPELEKRKASLARTMMQQGVGNPDEETFEALVDEEVEIMLDEERADWQREYGLSAMVPPMEPGDVEE